MVDRCRNCGGSMIGDGYTLVYHCEYVDIFDAYYEPDAGPIYCQFSEEDDREWERLWLSDDFQDDPFCDEDIGEDDVSILEEQLTAAQKALDDLRKQIAEIKGKV